MKKIFCILCSFLLAFMCVSCSNENLKRKDEVNKLLTEVTSIKLADVAVDMYKTPLDILLTDEEVQEVKLALDNATRKEDSFTGFLYYALELYDKSGNLVDKIIVDTQDTVKLDSGDIYKRSDKLDTVLKSVEQTYNISTDIWNRQPGSGYFELLELVERGQIYEITDNNFVQGINIDLSKSECNYISESIKDISFDDVQMENVNTKYVVELYSAAGGSVYILYIDGDGNVYTDQKYKLECPSLKACFETIINDVK